MMAASVFMQFKRSYIFINLSWANYLQSSKTKYVYCLETTFAKNKLSITIESRVVQNVGETLQIYNVRISL